MPDAGKQKNPAASTKDKSIANELLDKVNDRRPAAGRMTPVGTEVQPDPTTAPSAPVTPAPARMKPEKDKKKQ